MPAQALIPNDPYYAGNQWYAPLIGLPAAWDRSTGSTSVKVAVLDTGVIPWTPDFGGRILPNQSATGGLPSSGETIRHGTWVTSTLAMGVNNGIGGAGVGNFTVLPILITNTNGFNSSDWIADGIRMAADQGAKVINISHASASYNLLDDAAAYARSKGALTFMAAGNSDSRNSMAGYENLIFVAGTDPLDGRWRNGPGVGSTWGPFVDLSAPAVDMLVADPVDTARLPDGYGVIDGTSFAAPLAAGAAALAWSINPALTPDEVWTMLRETAVDLGAPGWDEVFGHGRLNVDGVTLLAALSAGHAPEPTALALVAVGGVLALRRRRQVRPAA